MRMGWKMRQKRGVTAGGPVISCIIALSLSTASAQITTNMIPFGDAFETIANNTTIIGFQGWNAPTSSCAIVTNAALSYTLALPPLRYETHNKYVILNTENYAITNQFQPSTNAGKKVLIDTMVQFQPWSDENPPTSVTNDRSIQSAFFVNTNKNLVIYHSRRYSISVYSNQFTVILSPTINSNEWHRLTVTMDHTTSPTKKSFQVQIDGASPITNEFAYQLPTTSGQGLVGTGSWFVVANNLTGASNYMSGVAISGTGCIDDFVVTNDQTRYGWVITATNILALGGQLSPQGIVEVTNGATITFTNILNTHWIFDSVVKDGTTGTPEQLVAYTNVTSDGHTYLGNFSAIMATNAGPAAGTPNWWLATYAPAAGTNDAGALLDSDGDGYTNWQEHLASTDPTDAGSYFKILSHYQLGGTQYVRWVSPALDIGLPPFGVKRSTNIVIGGWILVDGNVQRNPTNTWAELNPITNSVPSFYRIVATNNIP